jgi:hypothetical protein
MSKLEFITTNGFRDAVLSTVDRATQLFDMIADNAHARRYGFSMKPGPFDVIGREGLQQLVYAHNVLARMTVNESIPPEMVETHKFNAHCMDSYHRTHLDKVLMFVKGAVSDPFLYASGDASQVDYQQAAVLGLHKARTALQWAIESLLGEKE